MKLQLSAFKQEINKLTRIDYQTYQVVFVVPEELIDNDLSELYFGSIDVDEKDKTVYIHLEGEQE